MRPFWSNRCSQPAGSGALLVVDGLAAGMLFKDEWDPAVCLLLVRLDDWAAEFFKKQSQI